MGRVHLGRQEIDKLQTRKMKGLKRTREVEDIDDDLAMSIDDDEGAGRSKKAR